MNILVVGGTGLIGGHIALYFKAQGHNVTISARSQPQAGSALESLDFIPGNYIEGYDKNILSRFDALIFSAGNDPRHVEGDADAHWIRANVEGIPRFFEQARDAGISTAINVGSFYPQVRPSLIETVSYIRSRHLADEGLRALNNEHFRAISVNAPYVIGYVPGLVTDMFQAYTAYARGKLTDIPRFAPKGGVNFISTRSLTEAVAGALDRGEGGKAYLVGDENLTFQEYFGAFFKAAGDHEPLPVSDDDHPLMPNSSMLWGAGENFFFEPGAKEVELLGYRRNDVMSTIPDIVKQYP